MIHNNRYPSTNHPHISAILETSDTLTSRAGLLLFARYLNRIGFFWCVELCVC